MEEVCEQSGKTTDLTEESRVELNLCKYCSSEEDLLKGVISDIKNAITQKNEMAKTVDELKNEVNGLKDLNNTIMQQLVEIKKLLLQPQQLSSNETVFVLNEKNILQC